MTAQDIRNKYLEFFTERAHQLIPRSPLVPKEDATTLFTGSGMQQLMPYLLGESHPGGTKLVDSQTCLRAQDIDDIGDNRHTTFFEMLGNWSLGDYFKEQQIRWFFEYLVDVVGLDPNRIYATCFIGDEKNGIPKDTQSAEIWQKLFAERGVDAEVVELGTSENGDKVGMQGGRVFYYDDQENWWSRGGGIEQTPIGDPCGPDSEVFFDFGEELHDESKWGKAHPANDSGRFMEIGNQVFMQYQRTEDGFVELPNKNVDFGGGLERIAAAAIDSPDVFKISIMWPIIEKIEELSGKKYDFTPGDLGYDSMPDCWFEEMKSMRVISDHLRAGAFLAVDGVTPSNKEQGYVMRRLLRRAIRFAFELGIEQNFMQEIVPVIADMYEADFPEVKAKRAEIIAILVKEEKAFRQTIRKGLREFAKIAEDQSKMGGAEIFTLYDTYGFPLELSTEEATKTGVELDDNWREQFDAKMNEQRQRSQTAAKGTFKGGLGGQTLQHKKYHTATHLMYQALRDVLGDHVVQHGSNITEERLRFDFSHPEKMTPEQIKAVEDIVNEQIAKDLQVSFAEYPTEEATGPLGALGQFGDRYGDTVKVYSMKDANSPDDERAFSFEICGGPHVDHTLQLFEDGKKFKIQKEQSSSAGIRRIKAVLV